MAKFFVYPFAVAGTKTAIPDPLQGSGSVSYNEGWGPDYGLDLNTDSAALPMPRDQMNELFFDITDGIRQYQSHGVPDFITTSDNLGTAFPYDLYARVRYDDGTGFKIYENQLQGNTALPSDPSWEVISGGQIPTGVWIPYGGDTAPGGWLLCDGSAVNRTTYAALFSKIGTKFGAGDGSTTFNLPFMARRTVVGAGGTASGILGNTIGSVGGAEAVSLTSDQNGDHTHATIPGYTFRLIKPAISSQNTSPVASTGTVDGGAGNSHNNIQPSLVGNWIIKT